MYGNPLEGLLLLFCLLPIGAVLLTCIVFYLHVVVFHVVDQHVFVQTWRAWKYMLIESFVLTFMLLFYIK